ncbi:MAG: LytTR family DNA-binding domain-containing protein [Bacteroidota bacterium]
MNMLKVLLVDDEAPARSLLREYLSDHPELVIVGEANNGVDAVRAIREFRPELVFLDIQMPGMTGFEVLQQLKVMPQIIFTTAYDQYALKAFEVHAVDYLLKPYTKARFANAIQRVLAPDTGNLEKLRRLTEGLLEVNSTSYPSKILVSAGQKLVALNPSDILWVQAEKDYCRLITAQKRYLSNSGIGAMEQRLDPEMFLRVHRSSIVNLNAIKEIEKYGASYDIIMQNGDVVRVSRGYLDAIRKLVM